MLLNWIFKDRNVHFQKNFLLHHLQVTANLPCMASLKISISKQRLFVFEHDDLIAEYPIATASRGVGQREGSEQTPLGHHAIAEKIGGNAPLNTVFVGRKPTGERYSSDLGLKNPERDWILTRILWLTGLEPGKNQGGDCDTKSRYIYIHGTPEAVPLGQPSSHGCIRMHGKDIIALFDRVAVGDEVFITSH